MSFEETDLTERLHAVADTFEMSPARPIDDAVRGRRLRRRRRTLVVGAAAAATAVILGVAVVVGGPGSTDSDGPEPVERPGLVVGEVPVWYDTAGLHRGDVVEPTPVELRTFSGGSIEEGALALVRTGAVYLDPATGDIWFHPWGGDPRIVGRDSAAGPGADSNGDVAVWFEGDRDLVVYDTAADHEIARAELSSDAELPFGSNTCHALCAEHYQPGNGFLQVSAEQIVWTASQGHGPTYAYDVSTATTSAVPNVEVAGPEDAVAVDVRDEASAYAIQDDSPWGWHLMVDVPGRAPQHYPELNPRSRFSPSGRYVLGHAWVGRLGERSVAAILDTRTGELWPGPASESLWSVWSYGDIALVQEDDQLLACHAEDHTCSRLPAEAPFLMPTN
jgi:hypothetical protein